MCRDAGIRPSGFLIRVTRRGGEGPRRPAISHTKDRMFPQGRRRNDRKFGRRARRCIPFRLEALEPRRLLSTYVVNNTETRRYTIERGSVRAAILAADADTSPGTDDIVFDIPASTAPDLERPGPGFRSQHPGLDDHARQPLAGDHPFGFDRWLYQAAVERALPLSRRRSARPFRSRPVVGSPTGGTFTLTHLGAAAGRDDGRRFPTTPTPPPSSRALETIVGAGNVIVTGGPVPTAGVTISFEGAYRQVGRFRT